MKVTQAIDSYLTSRLNTHPGRDLIDRFLAAGGAASLEVQLNVRQGDGEAVAGRRNTYTDGITTWHNIRSPKNAHDNPEAVDYELCFPLEEHAEGIGATGWRWTDRQSLWCGFDVDSITGHAKGVGVTDEELARVCEAAKALPYVEVRRSTGGKGIHLYVCFDGIPTANHTEHAALARCVLGMMSSEVNFDFAGQIDACGQVMWLWHRKLTHDGLALLKPAPQVLTIADLPLNWRDHIEVVSRKRAKVKLSGVPDDFEAMASSRNAIPLDASHKAVIAALGETGCSTIWVEDHHLLQTHTVGLQELINDPESRQRLGLVGAFLTNSQGKDKGQPNCFLFPLSKGGWRVFRFSQGINETPTWTQDGNGWTTCYFNRLLDFDTACKINGGVKDPEAKTFVFTDSTCAVKAAEAVGQTITLPADWGGRTVSLKLSDGKIVCIVDRDKTDEKAIKGWVNKKTRWVREFDKRIESELDENEVQDHDEIVRTLITPGGESAGWVLHAQDKLWVRHNAGNVKLVLQNKGMSKLDAEVAMGGAICRHWRLINLPFREEYPGGRQWNMDSPQFVFKPSDTADQHPHWDMIYRHLGTNLDAPIKEAPWAIRMGIKSGAQYLLTWVACMFREPFEQLPYLFFFGDENCGKSMFHEALSEVLVTGGIVKAEKSLAKGNEFNGELANAILCVVEETNVAASPVAHGRIKEWITAKKINIRKMRTDAYTQANTTHWVQCANDQSFCPVYPGDSRITVIQVNDLLVDVPRQIMMQNLKEEASHFMHTLLNVELPPIECRLRLPVIETAAKLTSQEFNQSELEQFITENCHESGESILFKDFYDKFYEWLGEDQRRQWSRKRCAQKMPVKFAIKTGSSNKKYVPNLSFEPR